MTYSRNLILHMGTYPPRKCGIATYTEDICNAMNNKFNPQIESKIIAMDKESSKNFEYSNKVIHRINDNQVQEYIDTAKKINMSDDVKLVDIQHEYGIFGGNEGDFLLDFLKNLKKPVVLTLHTVSDNPHPYKKKITQELIKYSQAVVVIINKAKRVLVKEYGIDKNKISVIPHGIHPVPFKHPPQTKTFFNSNDKIVLSTFGLLGGKSKGLDYIIEALPYVTKKYPNVIYAILGAIHPDVLKANKGKVRSDLKNKIKTMGLNNHVKFYDYYLSLKDLLTALQETDIYLTPYAHKDRKSSGTLAYAMGCGRVCISTPFYFAEDIIKNMENGIIVDFKDSKGFADAIIHILDNPDLKTRFEKRSYEQTRHMTWPNIANNYYQVYKHISK